MTQYVVVVERGKKSVTVGPFTSRQAYAMADLFNGDAGRKAWVEVIVPIEAYTKQHVQEILDENRGNPDV